MTDRNADAADSPGAAELFEAEMNQPLLDGHREMDPRDAEAVYAQIVLATEPLNLSDATYCKAIVALAEAYLFQERFREAVLPLTIALEILQKYLPPCHEQVGAMRYLLATTYEFCEEYELASEQWIAVIHCFSWLPDWVPVLREAAEGLLRCRGKQGRMPDLETFRDIIRRDAA